MESSQPLLLSEETVGVYQYFILVLSLMLPNPSDFFPRSQVEDRALDLGPGGVAPQYETSELDGLDEKLMKEEEEEEQEEEQEEEEEKVSKRDAKLAAKPVSSKAKSLAVGIHNPPNFKLLIPPYLIFRSHHHAQRVPLFVSGDHMIFLFFGVSVSIVMICVLIPQLVVPGKQPRPRRRRRALEEEESVKRLELRICPCSNGFLTFF